METTSKAQWIWYPGDFEVWLGNRFNNRRTERGAMFPPFWKQDSHWVTVEFSTTVRLDKAETIEIKCEGDFNMMLDGKLQFGMPESFTVPAGKHRLNFKVHNQATPPALYVSGETIRSNATWLATYEDKIWIDENGVAHGSGIYVPAATWCFDSPDTPPSKYRLERKEQRPVTTDTTGMGMLYDFGRETFGYLRFKHATGNGHLYIYYGESCEEALDKEHCETLDRIEVSTKASQEIMTQVSKAFRYVYVEIDGDATHNPQAIADIVDLMDTNNIGYCSVNHNRNRCMDCGYEDAQENLEVCPTCGSRHIDKLQRITGYLVGTTDRWNSAKLAELSDRVVHK